jgi:hypothetical protein
MLRLRSLMAAGALLVGDSVAACAEAPRPLFNNTIQISWTTSAVERSADGQVINPQIAVNWTIYVSTAGRLFARGARSVGRREGQSDIAPGATKNKAGEATGVRFVGNKLVGNIAYAMGAVNFVATFDRTFRGCTVQVMYGREGGKMMRRGLDGVMRQIQSLTASGQTCSVREGNAFEG